MYREPYYDERDFEDGGDTYYYAVEDEDEEEAQEPATAFETVIYQPPARRKEVR